MRLVYLSPAPWTSFAQRPHKFVEWFHARFGAEVLWIDPYPTRLLKLEDVRRNTTLAITRANSQIGLPPWLQVIRPNVLPIEPLPALSPLNRFLWRNIQRDVDIFLTKPGGLIGIGKPSALALQVLSRHLNVKSFYDAMDNFPAFYEGLSRRAMVQSERAVANQVSNILVSSTALAGRFQEHKKKVLLTMNGFDTLDAQQFSFERLKSNTSTPPVLGYVGTIGNWFDWPLVVAIANANPMMRIRLIGPLYRPPPLRLPPTIELLPACDHATAILAMQDFSVGLIPFKQTELTASVDPIKYYEYRALGLPVVSTSFGEMKFRGDQNGVFLVSDQSNLTSVVALALAYESNKEEMQHFRNENSWGARFDACGLFA